MPLNPRSPLLSRHFLAAVSAVLLVMFAGMVAVQWVFFRQAAIRHSERAALRMTSLLERELQSSFPLATILGGLSDPEMYEYFDHLIQDKLRVVGLEEAAIYDPEGRIVYATDRSLLGSRPTGETEVLRKARRGVVTRTAPVEGRVHTHGGFLARACVLTYIPLPLGENPEQAYVLEAHQDFGPAGEGFIRAFALSSALTAALLGAAMAICFRLYRQIHRLRETVETLESFLPICARCKKIRVKEEGVPEHWVSVEEYFEKRQNVAFTHGLCEECLERLYPDLGSRPGKRHGTEPRHGPSPGPPAGPPP